MAAAISCWGGTGKLHVLHGMPGPFLPCGRVRFKRFLGLRVVLVI